ncbi:ECF transporter S component [Escherichia coli]|nr:ECF transporter S component [Escherichia coli]EFE0768219.1 ECF transporter S component [Escherichia coli]EFI3295126.1 ECF transporter S component [Escherichia coli]EFI3304628.1 ECF transporter S component [Escherichia coli]
MARSHFSSQALVLIVISIAINMIGGQLASMVKLPIFLDSIGTLISAVLLGPVIGMLTGLLTNLLWGLLTDPIAAAFAPVAMVIGLVAGCLARAGWFRTLPKVVVSGVIITLAVTVVAVPLRTALFGGVTGSGADLFVAWMHSMGQNLVESVAITVIGANLVDKILTAVIVWLLLRQLPIRTTLILPAQTILPIYSAATFFCLIALKATRRRAKYVVWLMFSLGAGLWLVHGGWLPEWLSGTPRSPERWSHAITLWLRILAIVSTSQLWMQYVPVQCFIRALFASRLPPGVAYLFAGPLLVVEQLKRQLAIIHEAQRARGVPLDEGWYQRLRAMPALIIPLTHNALNDLAVRGAALDMRAFRIHNRRTTLWAPADSTLQRVARYTMILLMLTEFGAWIWLR